MLQTVKVGQVWVDADSRRQHRNFQIEAILSGTNQALCKSLTGTGLLFTKIRLDRFYPKYYVLLQDVLPPATVTSSSFNPMRTVTPSAGSQVASVDTSRQTKTVTYSNFANECNDASMFQSNWEPVALNPNAAKLVNGRLTLLVRRTDGDTYDTKVMYDGLIVETSVSYHVDLDQVMDNLYDMVMDLMYDFDGVL